ncbi:MAG: alanine racemase [Vicinamibacterales bacterium]
MTKRGNGPARTGVSRRRFLASAALAGCAAGRLSHASPPAATGDQASRLVSLRPGGGDKSFDPWIEIDAAAFRHNVKEVSRLAGGTPIMAVVKNNAYGLGDTLVGPLLAACDEVVGIGCVRVAEAIAMREAGVTKPILNMAEVTDTEAAELVSRNVWLSPWLDDAGQRLDRLARRFERPIPVHLYLDTGLGREGMPYHRALPWMADLAGRRSVRLDGTYMMFTHDLEFDREQLARFVQLAGNARARGLRLGRLHASPSYELFFLPDARLDMVRVGNALFGNHVDDKAKGLADLKPVFRLCARVVRVEQLRPGDGVNFRREYVASRPTWTALLPVGHVDGYPADASGTCRVLVNGRLYPVVGAVSSTHTIVELGDEKTVNVGDVATLIGPDDPEIDPHVVATRTRVGFYRMITKLNALLPRRVVGAGRS